MKNIYAQRQKRRTTTTRRTTRWKCRHLLANLAGPLWLPSWAALTLRFLCHSGHIRVVARTMMRLIFSRLITNCPHEQRQMRIANANVAKASATTQDNTSSKRKRTKDEGSKRGEKHFGRGPKYLTLQMKWQNVESNAQTAQNVMPEQGRGAQYSRGQGGRAEGEHKDRAKRCDTDWQQQNWNERDAARHSKMGSRRRAWGGEGREAQRVRGDRKTLIFFYCGRRAQ